MSFSKEIGKKLLLNTWMLLGSFPVFSDMLGFRFLPSIEWMATANLVGVVAGVASAVMLLRLVQKRIASRPVSEWRRFCSVICAPLFGFVLGKNIVVLVGPMAVALIAGQQVELSYTVDHNERSGSKGCRSPIGLQGLPFLFDRLCGVPDDIRRGFKPGSQVVVTGRGTTFGVYPESLRL